MVKKMAMRSKPNTYVKIQKGIIFAFPDNGPRTRVSQIPEDAVEGLPDSDNDGRTPSFVREMIKLAIEIEEALSKI